MRSLFAAAWIGFLCIISLSAAYADDRCSIAPNGPCPGCTANCPGRQQAFCIGSVTGSAPVPGVPVGQLHDICTQRPTCDCRALPPLPGQK